MQPTTLVRFQLIAGEFPVNLVLNQLEMGVVSILGVVPQDQLTMGSRSTNNGIQTAPIFGYC